MIILIRIAIVFIIVMVIAFIQMLLWNWLMPYLFALPLINIWKSVGLLFLTTFLFRTNVSKK